MKKVSFDCLVVAHFNNVPLPDSMDDKSGKEILYWIEEQLQSSNPYQYFKASKDNKYVSFEMENYYSEQLIADDVICIEDEDGSEEEVCFERY